MSFLSKPPVELSKLLGPRTTTALVALSVYLATCQGLRYLRRDRSHAKYPYKTKEDLSKMTAQDAWEISRYVMTLEFPMMTEKALQFALFKTYGIPTISTLLCKTQQLATESAAPRRYADTTILILEFLAHEPTSERANAAIARMNFLHGMYQKAGKISNDDMLYTLSLFVLEVERWIRLYEWRKLTDMEICALGTLWKSIGDAMAIDFSPLAHYPSFTSGLEFFHDLSDWALDYEERVMLPDKYNHQLAEETTSILLYNIPGFLKPGGKNIVSALMDDRLRIAMMYPAPSKFYVNLTHAVLGARRLVLKYLLPPRPEFMRYSTLSKEADPKTGRYHATVYEAEPWYYKSTFWTRNAPSSWVRWATGRPYPDGKRFQSEGYKIEEVGPQKYEKMGLEEVMATKERLLKERSGGCPFAVAR